MMHFLVMRATHITLTCWQCWVTPNQLIVKIQTYLSVERSARTQDSTQPHTAQGNVNVRVRYQARPGQDVTAVLVSQVNVSQQSEVRTRTLPDTETGDDTITSVSDNLRMASSGSDGVKLPPEIWTQIFSPLGVRDLCNVLLVSIAH